MNDPRHKNNSALKGKRSEAFHGIPESYFDQLPEKVMKGIDQYQKHRKIRLKVFAMAGIAAGFLILIGFSLFLLLQNPGSDSKRQYAKSNNSLVMKDSMKEVALARDKIKADASDTADLFIGKDRKEAAEESDIFDELDDIPIEVIIEYLYSFDEFEF